MLCWCCVVAVLLPWFCGGIAVAIAIAGAVAVATVVVVVTTSVLVFARPESL